MFKISENRIIKLLDIALNSLSWEDKYYEINEL
jgi:hypothetical protein